MGLIQIDLASPPSRSGRPEWARSRSISPGLVARSRRHRRDVARPLPTPVCVVVSDGGARLDPAGDVCGLPTGPAPSLLQERYGPDAAVAVIGPAGERGVPYASIITCRHHPRPRLGLGAVLGAKNVKAGLDALDVGLVQLGRWRRNPIKG